MVVVVVAVVVVDMFTPGVVATSVLSLISVVVTFKNVVVVGVVVKTPGVVALRPFVSALGRRGAAKEEKMGKRRNKENILFLSSALVLCRTIQVLY